MNYYGQIYKIVNTKTGKTYIGKTTKKYLGQRVGTFKRHNKELQKDIKDLVVSTVCYVYDRFTLDYLERYYISLYKDNSYNILLGGDDHHNELCVNCGKLYKFTRCRNNHSLNFCSVDCQREYYYNNNMYSNSKITVICDMCKRPIERFESNVNNLNFCDKNCQHDYYKQLYKGENNPNHGGTKQQGALNGRSKKCKCLETGEIFDYCRQADLHYGFKIGSVSAVCRGSQKSTHDLHFVFC